MRKPAYFAAVLLSLACFRPMQVSAWTGPSCGQGICSIDIDRTNDYITLVTQGSTDKIMIENSALSAVGAELNLVDTNPAAFALFWNTLREGVTGSGFGFLRVWYIPNFAGANGTYNKITQVRLR